MSERNEPVVTVTLPAPIETVWTTFRDPALIRRWFGWEYDTEQGTLDDEVRMIFSDGTVASEADRTLHVGGHLFELEDAGAETVVRVTRTTPLPGGDLDWDAFYDDVDEGWVSFLQQLRFALAHHWGQERTTIRLEGAPSAQPPAELRDLEALEPGRRYATTVAGEAIEGEMWFGSAHQFGLTVDGWGPGLLLFAAAPAGTTAAITITTYGDGSDPERAARWQTWWAAAYG